MDPRAEHLIALVEDGATLEEAARVYGITRERVRQILKGEGVIVHRLPGRRQKIRQRQLTLRNELGPAVEAMWREGMLFSEIAKVFGMSLDVVRQMVCERVPRDERITRTTERLHERRSPDERYVQGLRQGASILGQNSDIKTYEHLRALGLIEGWLAAREQPTEREPDRNPLQEDPTNQPGSSRGLTPGELRSELDRFRRELRAAGLRESTVHSYALGSSRFVRWLAGDYVPAPGRADRMPRRRPLRPATAAPAVGLCPECRV